MVQNPQFLINIRKNINANNPGYGKYYPKAVEKETITLRGLAKHMAEHQCVYSRDIIEGVLTKMASCMIELISQGNSRRSLRWMTGSPSRPLRRVRLASSRLSKAHGEISRLRSR